MKFQGEKPLPPRKAQVPARTHVVVVAGYVDLGTQPGFKADEPAKQRLSLIFEFPSVLVTTRDERRMPAWLFQDYSATMGSAKKPSNLRKVFEAALNVALDANSEYDPRDLVGRALQVKVTHDLTDTGSEWERVGDALALPEGFAAPALKAAPLIFDLRDEQGELVEPPERLGEWRIKKIKQSIEWSGPKAASVARPGDSADDTPF